MIAPKWIRKTLQAQRIPFEELHYCEAPTAQEVAGQEQFGGPRAAEVVVVLADGRFVELIFPAGQRPDLDRVRSALGARAVRPAREEELADAFADCELDAIPALPFGTDVGVLMDRSLYVEGDIQFQAGTHTDAIRLNFWDWYDLVKPQVATFGVPAEVVHA